MNKLIFFSALIGLLSPATMQAQILTNADITPEMVKEYIANRPKKENWENPTGPYRVEMEYNQHLLSHTIYRPANLDEISSQNRMPVVLMSGPGCDCDGDSFRPFYTQIASYGYVVVVAGPPVPDGVRAELWHNTPEDLLAGLDFILNENQRPESAYYGKIDNKKVALFGQSCGGIQCLRMADDPRVSTLVFWNSGSTLMGNVGPTDNTKRIGTPYELMGTRDVQQLVCSLSIPIAYFIGDTDMAIHAAEKDFQQITKAPVFFAVRHIAGDSHAGTFREKNGGAFGQVAVNYLNCLFKNDPKAAQVFQGNPTPLAEDKDWVTVKKKNWK